MPAFLLVPPAAEPVSLAEMKSYLRLDHGEEDALVATLITAARAACELACRRAFVTQTWRLVRDRWPADGRIKAPVAPLVAVAAARVLAADGTPTALDLARVVVADGAVAVDAAALPAPGRAVAGIEIDVVAGHGGPGDVPGPLREAVRAFAAHVYEHRGAGAGRPPMPADVALLLAPYRELGL